MNTPTREFLRRPERRRSARQALAVIPDMTGLTVSPGDIISQDGNAMDNLANSRQGIDSWSPAPSPDELVIQKRGRRRKTIVWSPDVDARKRDSLFSLSSRDRTPVKSPTKSNIVLRSTPRKRLMLGDSNDQQLSTPDKLKKITVDSQKNLQVDSGSSQKRFSGNLGNGLRGLSHEQLVKIIMDLISMQEDGMLSSDEKLRDVVLKKMPIADIQPLRERMYSLRQNIFASVTSSNMDESAYSRAYVHFDAFQKAVSEQGEKLVESQHWTAVMQYVITAWNITRDLPEWENQSLNATKRNCFRALVCCCMSALTNGAFVSSTLDAYAKKLESMVGDCDDLKVCLQYVKQAQGSETK